MALSMVVPGSGYLWMGSGLALIWFGAAAVLTIILQKIFLQVSFLSVTVNFLAFAGLGFLCARQTEQDIERQQRKYIDPAMSSQIFCLQSGANKIHAQIEIDIPKSAEELWKIISDPEKFLCIDPLHSRVVVMGTCPLPRTDILLEHQILGFRFLRFGKILSWRLGKGYSFSDLSAKGPRFGFPHVFFIEISDLPEEKKTNRRRSKLSIVVKGQWTARWIPRALRHWWLNKICHEHALLLMKGLSDE